VDGALVIARRDGIGARRITVASGPVNATPAWSPDGRRIAVVAGSGAAIEIVPLDGGRPLRVDPAVSIGIETTLSWSPDGTHLLYSEYDRLHRAYGAYAIDLATGSQRRIAPFGTDASYSRDGTKVVFGGWNGAKDPPPLPTCVGVGIWVVAAAGGRPTRVASHCNNRPLTIAASAPRELVYGDRGELTGSLLPGFGTFVAMAAHPCGRKSSTFATASVDGLWSRPIAPPVTTTYSAASDVERTTVRTVVSPRVSLRQTGTSLTFEVSVNARRSFAGKTVRIEIGNGAHTKTVVLQRGVRRNGSATTTGRFRLGRNEVKPWQQSIGAVLPKRTVGRCLAAGFSNELAVSRP
jgi:WD40-like Beta Propeller Repeat